MMRVLGICVAVLALAACEPKVPDSGAGVGFQNYADYMRARQEQLNGQQAATKGTPPATGTPAAAAPVTTAPLSAIAAAPAGGVDLAANLAANRPRGDAPATIRHDTGEMDAINDPKISDEQSFKAVSARETIESDKERLARQRAQYQVIPPTELPARPADTGPNIVQYALNSTNPVGHQAYRRANPFRKAMSARACASYASDDQAQAAFLAAGGPKRDPRNLDPDGDGYACTWDPAPYRTAIRN